MPANSQPTRLLGKKKLTFSATLQNVQKFGADVSAKIRKIEIELLDPTVVGVAFAIHTRRAQENPTKAVDQLLVTLQV